MYSGPPKVGTFIFAARLKSETYGRGPREKKLSMAGLQRLISKIGRLDEVREFPNTEHPAMDHGKKSFLVLNAR